MARKRKKDEAVSNRLGQEERTEIMVQSIVDRLVKKNYDAMVMCLNQNVVERVRLMILDRLQNESFVSITITKKELKTNIGRICFTTPRRAEQDLRGMRIRLYIDPSVWDSDTPYAAKAFVINRETQWDIRKDEPR